MDVVEKRLTEAVKDHEEYLGDFLGLDIRGADCIRLVQGRACAAWHR